MHEHYLSFLEAVQTGTTSSLELFTPASFWKELKSDEKEKLADLFFKRAEEALAEQNEEKLSESLTHAEEILEGRYDAVLKLSTFLYRFGVGKENKNSLLLALGKMVQIEEKTPEFFERDYRASHLWGNLLVALHRIQPDDSFLEKAIQKYEKALLVADKKNQFALHEVYWDLGVAYLYLGNRSKEFSDLKHSVDAFAIASKYSSSIPHFWLDYGEALLQLGKLLGEPDYLREAVGLYKEVIAKLSALETPREIAYTRAWTLYALTSKKIVELTHDEDEFDEASKVLQEALVACPELAFLWLHWGELYLRFGWVKRDLSFLDKGLEKLTALKTTDCDQEHLSALLSEGLILLGLCLEDLRLIKEGEKRVLSTLSQGRFEQFYAAGISNYAQGCYFGDEKYFLEALDFFERALLIDSSSLFARNMIFECGMNLAELKGETHYVRKSVETIARASQLAPKVPLYWSAWGIGLLKWHFLERNQPLLVEQAIEKFRKAISLDEKNPDLKCLFHYGIALDTLGGMMEDEKAYESAIEILSDVHEKLPDSLSVIEQLALVYFHLGELTGKIENHFRAIDLFESVVKYDQEDDGAWCGLGCTYLNLSEHLEGPIESEQSEEMKIKSTAALLRSAELGNQEALYQLACLHSLKGNLEKSMEYLLKAEAFQALPEMEELMHDAWLENVRQTEAFRTFLMTRDEPWSDCDG